MSRSVAINFMLPCCALIFIHAKTSIALRLSTTPLTLDNVFKRLVRLTLKRICSHTEFCFLISVSTPATSDIANSQKYILNDIHIPYKVKCYLSKGQSVLYYNWKITYSVTIIYFVWHKSCIF
ncbi:hypothetical protein N499_0728 [Wolbachia pipientis wVitA]|nr:hypothetical protein N499_0728 [Wolbachia pipientis wVitA]